MKPKSLLFITFFGLLSACSKDATNPASDSFIKFYGGFTTTQAFGVDLTKDEGYVLVGTSDSTNAGSLIYIKKVDKLGKEGWTQTLGKEDSTGNNYGRDIKTLDDGSFVVLCDKSFNKTVPQNANFDSTDVHLVQISLDGKELKDVNLQVIDNNKHLPMQGRNLQKTADGGFLIVGELKVSALATEMYLAKTDANLIVLWTRRYGAFLLPNEVSSVVITENEELVWCGADFRRNPAFGDFRVTKTNKDGGILFDRTYINFPNGYNSEGNDKATDIRLTREGFIVVGFVNETNVETDISTSESNENSQMVLMSLFPDGTERWIKTFGGDGKDKLQGVLVEDANYLVTGYQTVSGRKRQIYFSKFDPNGNELWGGEPRLYGGSENDQGKVIKITSDGRYIVLGTAEQTRIKKICLIKTEFDGWVR